MSMSMNDVKDMEAEMKVDDELVDFYEDEYECNVCGEINTETEFLLNDGCCFNCASKLV